MVQQDRATGEAEGVGAQQGWRRGAWARLHGSWESGKEDEKQPWWPPHPLYPPLVPEHKEGHELLQGEQGILPSCRHWVSACLSLPAPKSAPLPLLP